MTTIDDVRAVRRKQSCSCLSRQFGISLEERVYTTVTSIRTSGPFTTSQSGRRVMHIIRKYFLFYSYEPDVFINRRCKS
jgi:hypothetical protein